MVNVVGFCRNICRFGKRSHRTHQSAAIHTVEDVATGHSNIRITMHITCTTTAIDGITNGNLSCTFCY